MSTQRKGSEGELAAKVFLEDKGYTILEMNWRYKKYEVDLLASLGNELIVVEVKLRTTNQFGEPEQFVTKQKELFLIAAAEAYLKKNTSYESTRFDIISILDLPTGKKIRHLEGAFYPEIEDL